MAILAKSANFLTPRHAKNQKNLSRGSPGKLSERERERERETERERDVPEYKGPPDAIANPSDQNMVLLLRALANFMLLATLLQS